MNQDNKTVDELIEEVNKLMEEAALANQQNFGSSMKITDHDVLAEKYLSQKVKDLMLLPKSRDINVRSGSEKIAECIYLAVEASNDEIERAVQLLSEDLNKLADAGYIHSFLCHISSVELIKQFGKKATSVGLVYPLIYTENLAEARALVSFEDTEGGTGKSIGNLTKETPAGIFLAEISTVTMFNGKDPKEEISKGIDQYLSILPEGTELVSMEMLPIITLKHSAEVTFRNPSLPQVKRVSLEQIRTADVVDGKVIEGSKIVGVNFFDADGNPVQI